MSSTGDFFIRIQFGASVRRQMYDSFAEYLGQGIPINNIVKLLSESIRRAKSKSQMFQVKILDDIELQMSAGQDFSEALVKWIPLNEVMSIRAGLRSGDPVTGMRNTIDALDASSNMMGTIVGKLSYPATLLLALVGLVFFFSVVIIPQIANVLDPALWPPPAKKLDALASFVRSDWHFVLTGMIGTGFLVSWSLSRVTGQFRRYLDIIPPYSFYKSFHGANLLISIAALMKSGIPFVESLKEMRRMATPYLGEHLDRMILKMSEGKPIGDALNTGLLSDEMMVNVYMMSHNANFQNAISQVGSQAVKRSIEKISKISGMLNSIAILGVTIFVGWTYYAFFLVSNAMSQQANF